ncbi:Fic family protein [Dysgonomonas sp. 521]|uniref:Fic family protein n=1 Tax=Dysgonomonas sp. 521 TaxID=2302932 RepID=UPI0013D58A91|nr:Fic family protein [Dysgonomonas sp. 521]NDV96517.1 Fic family protein [Dysgonomonas sp. 521]
MINQLEKLIKEYKDLQPFDEDCKKKLDEKFRLEFNYNSNHLEGNTLTYGQTKLLLIFGDTTGNAKMRDYEEMKAHNAGLRWIGIIAKDKSRQLTERDIRDLNQIILVEDYWKINPKNGSRYEIKVGVYKTRPNSVITATGEEFHYASPEETPAMMNDFISWMNKEIAENRMSPVELASLVHYRYIRIHPFEDGNGRIARLLVNYVLARHDYPMVIIKSEDKESYLQVLHQCDINVGLTPSDGANAKLEDIKPFVEYMEKQLEWSLNLSIRAAKGESIEEQDDWEKQLSLLKKGLGDKRGEVVKKSEESVKAVFENVIDPFAVKLDIKLSQFDSLFMERSVAILWNDVWKRFESFEAALVDIYRIFRLPEDTATFENTNRLQVKFHYNKYRLPFTDITVETLDTNFLFYKNGYGVNYNNKVVTKLYSDFITEDEMNSIISDIGKDLLQKIEKAMNS